MVRLYNLYKLVLCMDKLDYQDTYLCISVIKIMVFIMIVVNFWILCKFLNTNVH